MAKEQIFSDALCLNITLEMRGRLNRFIAERCGRYAQTAPVVRDLINTCLAYYGYPSPEAQQPADAIAVRANADESRCQWPMTDTISFTKSGNRLRTSG